MIIPGISSNCIRGDALFLRQRKGAHDFLPGGLSAPAHRFTTGASECFDLYRDPRMAVKEFLREATQARHGEKQSID